MDCFSGPIRRSVGPYRCIGMCQTLPVDWGRVKPYRWIAGVLSLTGGSGHSKPYRWIKGSPLHAHDKTKMLNSINRLGHFQRLKFYPFFSQFIDLV